ncbi:MAG: hypothetical protein HZB53_00415 [Chloroflexi bacterium]|nr:hypothetical protein [Chloroflexota bacterium]
MFDWLGTARDVLVIGYMLFVRVGVPILLTWMLGQWLQKVLRESESRSADSAAAALTDPNCALGMGAVDSHQPAVPCWLALQISGHGLKHECYTCPLYTNTGRHLHGVPAVVRQASQH